MWGAAGSVSFALVSRLPVIREESDLDIVVRSDAPLSAVQIGLLQSVRASPLCRIGIQIDTGYGGFAFADWVNDLKRILLKTAIGPMLSVDPWDRTGGDSYCLDEVGKS
ncbi:MAG: hypothetical protein H7240_07515 [Glaciimonas sp.]|nr:hypothetical protein [Glaciimonas sp.]